MMNRNHQEFLEYVQIYVENNPDIAPQISLYVQNGLNLSLNKLQKKAADMETIAYISLLSNATKKNKLEIVETIISKWKNELCLNWKMENLK